MNNTIEIGKYYIVKQTTLTSNWLEYYKHITLKGNIAKIIGMLYDNEMVLIWNGQLQGKIKKSWLRPIKSEKDAMKMLIFRLSGGDNGIL